MLISLLIVIAFFVSLFIKGRSRDPGFKGRLGEGEVARILSRLPRNEYRVLNNITLKTPNGSTQIDHIVVSLYGIFVIETKNYNGWITGSEHGEYWTQTIWRTKSKLYNPILQNLGHIKALRRVLEEYLPLRFISVVAFSNKASVKVWAEDAYVIYWSQLKSLIRSYTNVLYGKEQVNHICRTILDAQVESGKGTEREHLHDIARARQHKSELLSQGKCPRCGGTLVLRDGRYGHLYGCSNYPKCRFIKNC